MLHDMSFAGESAADKIKRVQAALEKEKLDALVVSDPHALCWLFNIRGGDAAHTPLVIGYAILPRSGRPSLFLDGRKLDNAVRASLAELAEVEEPARFEEGLRALGGAKARVRLDAATAGERLRLAIKEAGGVPDVGRDPIALMKAVKNATEIEGSRQAHLRDGVAVTRFLAWLAKEAPQGAAYRDRCGAQARGMPYRDGLAEAAILSDDRRGRAACGDPALPGDDRERTARSRPASSSSIRAANIRTARPTSPARSPSVCLRKRCGIASRAC